jgi:23S rRNA (adenine-N6)-dimethyltransferase
LSEKTGRNLPVWVSQNFLTSKKTICKLIKRTSINTSDHVIEIGPGKGHITDMLLRFCRKLSAVEIDEKLYSRLHEKFGGNEKIKIYNRDFLDWRLPAEDYKVFANIPFCRTTEILRKLTDCTNPPTEAWLVMEKGAAKRFMGIPRESVLSLLIKPFFNTEIKYHFKKEDFHPAPSVETVLFHLSKKPTPDIPHAKRQLYIRFISTCFKKPGGIFRLLTKKQIAKSLKAEKLSCDITSGEILYIQWLCLFRCYSKHVFY